MVTGCRILQLTGKRGLSRLFKVDLWVLSDSAHRDK